MITSVNPIGLITCSRYSFPPNSLSLCGPARQKDLGWYVQSGNADRGTREIMSQFSTLYPYLSFIAYENNIRDPFDSRVVEAYWLGNNLLNNISVRHFAGHLSDSLLLKKKLPAAKLNLLMGKLDYNLLPCHAFHVTNVYVRTGHMALPHTVGSMDACLINWGKVSGIYSKYLTVTSRPLREFNGRLSFGLPVTRQLKFQGSGDRLAMGLKIGDTVSYHWGYFCRKINSRQLINLKYYTDLAIRLANLDYDETNHLRFGKSN